jgi:hypothetical protein
MSTNKPVSAFKVIVGVVRVAMLTALATAAPVLAVAQSSDHDHDGHAVSAKLVQIVRESTAQFINVNNLKGTGYAPAFGCVSGPDHGAMGIHYINMGLVGDGVLNEYTPEALIYEPVGKARRLVGVEYIVDAETWLSNNNNTPPQLEGQDFQFVSAPNRFGIPSFFELHVWAWRDNPQGAFVDWNNNVSCEGE